MDCTCTVWLTVYAVPNQRIFDTPILQVHHTVFVATSETKLGMAHVIQWYGMCAAAIRNHNVLGWNPNAIPTGREDGKTKEFPPGTGLGVPESPHSGEL